MLALHGRMEDVDGVVGRAAARCGLVRDQARITQAAHIYAVMLEIPAAPALARQLGNAVNGLGLHDRALRRVVRGRGGPERGNRAGPEDALKLMIARRLQHIQQAIHIERPAPRGRLLCRSRQRRRQVIDLRDAMALDDLAQLAAIGHIQRFVTDLRVAATGHHVAGHDVASAVALGQRGGQLRPQLPVGADDEDARRRSKIRAGAGAHQMIPSSLPAVSNALSAASSCARSCTALICTRMRACPLGTTG